MVVPDRIPMAQIGGLPGWLVGLCIAGAVAGGLYFGVRELRRDHQSGEYHFTWGVGIVVLFLLGFAPGLVGFGLYLTIERGYPVYLFIALLLAALLVLGILGSAVEVSTSAGTTSL